MRLVLRQWREADFEHFAALNADPEVMCYFPTLLTRAESDKLAMRFGMVRCTFLSARPKSGQKCLPARLLGGGDA
jgi:RimJ/RimL family protein N-acetyltransferase